MKKFGWKLLCLMLVCGMATVASATAGQNPSTVDAVVIAVGPGKENESMQVKEGDKVIYSKYAGTEVKIGEEEYIIVSQSDIIAVVE